MKIDWVALGVVAAVSIGMSVLFTILLAGGIRSVSPCSSCSASG
jgi:hypothetical protein